MPITKASGQAVAPAAKGDLVVGSATNDAAVLSVGSANQVLTVDSSTTTGLKWATASSGATTWTGRYSNSNLSVQIKRIEYNGSLYVAAGGDPGVTATLITSSDGITWTTRTSGFGTNFINAIIWDSTNSLWIIAGDNGLISTSSDGVTWTSRTANMGTNSIKDLATNAGTTVAVGGGGGITNTGGITYSTNGTTWTRKSQSITVGTTYNSVAYNGTNWVVGANNDTNNYLYASTPAGTWTAGQTGSSNTCYIIGWDGTKHIIRDSTSNNQPLWYSTSTTIGTPVEISNFYTQTASNLNVKSNVRLYNSRIYVAEGLYLINATTTISNTNFVYDISNRQYTPQYRGSTNATIDGYGIFSTGQIIFTMGVLYTSF